MNFILLLLPNHGILKEFSCLTLFVQYVWFFYHFGFFLIHFPMYVYSVSVLSRLDYKNPFCV